MVFCWVSLVVEMSRRSNFMKILKILKITMPKINRLLSKHFNISKILNDNCLYFNHFHPLSTFNLNSNSGWGVFTWLSFNLGCYCWYFNAIFLTLRICLLSSQLWSKTETTHSSSPSWYVYKYLMPATTCEVLAVSLESFS